MNGKISGQGPCHLPHLPVKPTSVFPVEYTSCTISAGEGLGRHWTAFVSCLVAENPNRSSARKPGFIRIYSFAVPFITVESRQREHKAVANTTSIAGSRQMNAGA